MDELLDEIYVKHARELFERLNALKQTEKFEKGEDVLTRLSVEVLQQSIKASAEVCRKICCNKE